MAMMRSGAGRKCWPGMVRSGRSLGAPTTGLSLPGTSGNYLSLADSNDLDVIGDAAWMFDGALTVWKPAVSNIVISKNATGNFSYRLFVLATTGVIRLTLSSNGTNTAVTDSSEAPAVSDGAAICVGATYRVSDQRVQFWTAPSGTATYPGEASWTQLGTDQTNAQTSIYAGAAPVSIGAAGGGTLQPLAGTVRRARVWASIDGTDQRLDVNCVGQAKTATRTPSTFTEAAKGATVTANGTGWDWLVAA